MKQREAEMAHVENPEYSTRERFAGAFIIIALLLLFGALAFSSQVAFLLSDTFTLHAEISTAEGVSDDAVVKYAGIEIGKVTDVELTPQRRVMLTLEIREKYHDLLREGSVAELNRLAILGDVTLEVRPGDPREPLLPDGGRIVVEETPALDTLLSRLAPAVQDVVDTADHARAVVTAVEPDAIRQMTDDLRLALADVRAITARVNSGDGTVGRLLSDEALAADVAAAADRLAGVLGLVQARLRELEPLLEGATARTEDAAALLDETTALIKQLRGAVEEFDSGDAVSGVLLEARSALDEAEKTLQSIRNTWPFSGNSPQEQPVQPVPPQPPAE